MSHELETMAYANAVPWHGLGFKVEDDLTPEQMLEAAKLDWSVSQHPMFAHVGEKQVPTDKFALIRDKDHSVLTVTSERWRPTQNHEAFEFFNKFCEVGGAKMETAGSLKGGRHVWALAQLGKSFTLPGGDKTEGYLLFSLPHEVGKSIQVRTTSVRVVCNNTLTYSLRSGTKSEYRQGHMRDFDFDAAAHVVEMANENLSEQAAFAKKLIKVEMDKFDAIQFFSELLSQEALERAEAEEFAAAYAEGNGRNSRLGKIYGSYLEGPGNNQSNAWGVLNGLTHYCDHVSGRDQSKRLWDSWFGNLSQVKHTAQQRLAEIA